MIRALLVAIFCILVGAGCSQPVTEPEVDIWRASAEGQLEIVEQHLKFGTDVNSTFSIPGLIGTGGTPLHLAVMFHQHDVTELLIENGADLNRRAIQPDPFGGTPLHWATAFENVKGVRTLLDAGADPNSTDNYGTTPLGVSLLDLTTFEPIEYDDMSTLKQQIHDLLESKGGR